MILQSWTEDVLRGVDTEQMLASEQLFCGLHVWLCRLLAVWYVACCAHTACPIFAVVDNLLQWLSCGI